MKSIIIIGGGVSGWCAALAFARSDFKVKILNNDSVIFGAQQVSPNGFKCLSELIGSDLLKKKIEKILQIKITLINEKKFKVLTNYDLKENFDNYGSISRKVLIDELRNTAESNDNIEIINEKADYLLKQDKQSVQILTHKGNILESDFIIGADGQNGICRNYVCGSEKKITKKIFRLVIENKNFLSLTKNLLQILLSDKGHFIIYPFNINDKNLINYVFVPNKNFQNISNIQNIPQYHHLLKISGWQESTITINNNLRTTFWKNNVFLFGEAALPMEPHLAQGGNQIFEDAIFLKKNVGKHTSFEEVVKQFVDNRIKYKLTMQKKASLFGEILGNEGILSLPRNIFISKYSKQFFNDFFESIWNNNKNE